MRVGLVCPYGLSTPGGVQDQVVGLAGALARLEHEVAILAPGTTSAVHGVTCVGRPFRFRVNGSIAPMAPQPTAAVRTVRALRRGRFDVLHLHEPLAPSITVPALLAHPAPIVGTFHAAGARTAYRRLGGSLRHIALRIDVRVAVSRAALELALDHLGGTYELLYNGIDLDRFRVAPRVAPAGPTILFLGRHEPRKGLDVLLDAVASLPPHVTVRVAGDGPDTRRLRTTHRREGRICWLGRLTEQDKLDELRKASVLCAPSRGGESFGIVLLEAMAAGTPVVASRIPGYLSVSDHGRAALLVPPGDPRALARSLVDVLSHDHVAARLRAHGDRHVRRYSMDDLALRYTEIYDRVAGGRNPSTYVVGASSRHHVEGQHPEQQVAPHTSTSRSTTAG